MTEENSPLDADNLTIPEDQPTIVEEVTSVHIDSAVSCSLSADNSMVMQVFLVAGENGPRKFAITYPAAKAEWLTNVFHEAWIMGARQGAPAGAPLQHMPDRYDIGNSPQRAPDGIQGYTGVCFDAGTPKEYTFVMPNVSALQFIKFMEMSILPALTPPEREMWKKSQVEIAKIAAQPRVVTANPKIILPPGLG